MKASLTRRKLIAIMVMVVSIAVLVAFFRHGYDALLALADLAQIELPFAQNRPGFLRKEISYRADAREHAADLYVPAEGARAGVVLVPGAAAEGRNDPRLVEFAAMLARSGFVVLVPDIQSLRKLQLTPGSIDEIADAFTFLRDDTGLKTGAWLGISAFSVAVGPVVLAALKPAIKEQVKFLLLVGGYHDLERTLTYLTTGYFEIDGVPQHREPNSYGKWVYALSNASRLQDPFDREVMSALALRKLDNPEAAVDDLQAKLNTGGAAVYDFITNSDPIRVPFLIANLPPTINADIAALNLAAYDLSKLRAEVILVHGRDDDIIPYTESVSLAAALPPSQANLFLLEGLHHVDRDIKGMDIWRMWRVMHLLLSPQND